MISSPRIVNLVLSRATRALLVVPALLFATWFVPLQNASAQTHPAPVLTGSFLADPAIPTAIVTTDQYAEYLVLNQDLSLRTQSTLNPNSINATCAPPAGFSSVSTTPRTLLADNSANVYFTAQSSSSANAAVSAYQPGSSTCASTSPLFIPGGTPNFALTSNDPQHGRFYAISGFNGNGPDTITVYANLNTNSSSTPSLTQSARTSLDTAGQYTSAVTDTNSNYGLTAITSLKTSTSPGNLFVYSPGINTAFRVLGPGGVALSAVSSFLLPNPQQDAGGSLLVLVNQDALTSSNLTAGPRDTIPFTIIDLGQLQRTFSAVVASGTTVTLPFVTQIHASASYNAMLGAAYNPANHLLYALVANVSGTSTAVQSILSYDPYHPSVPAETLVADVSNVPFTFGVYPQLALNAAAGTLDILASNPSSVYVAGIVGTGNTAVAVNGTTFPDSSFQPTYIAANQLLGETYIASRSGQVDILSRPSGAKLQATLTLNGDDIAIVNQSYFLKGVSIYPDPQPEIIGDPLTITATPKGGTPYTFATTTVGGLGTISGNSFPANGVYTLVATAPATANYAAMTSNPLVITVASNFLAGVYPTTLALNVPTTSTGSSVNAGITLSGSTYAPTGRIIVTDATGNQVGLINLTGGAITLPLTVSLTLPQGTSALTATYNGDDQNSTSASPVASISVGAKVTPAIVLTLPTNGTAGATLNGTVTLSSTSTTTPTGNITIYALPAKSTTPTTLAIVPAAQAFAGGGQTFPFTAPAAGTTGIFASYDGDSAYNLAFSPTYNIVTAGSTISTSLAVTAPATATAGTAFNAGVLFTVASASTIAPSGNVILTAALAGGATSTIATVPVLQTFGINPAAISVTLPTAGTYTLTATYAGDATYAASTKSSTVIIAAAVLPATLNVSAPASTTAGTSFIVTSTLATQTTSTTTITGNVVLTATPSGGAAITLATIPAAQVYLSGGKQTSVSLQSTGSYILTASYAGDANFSSASGSIGISVGAVKGTVVLGVYAPAGEVSGTAITGTVSATFTGNTSTPTGSVLVTAVPTSGNTNPSVVLGTFPAATLASAGTAGVNLPYNAPAAGLYNVTATYTGDTNFNAATPVFSTINVIAAPVIATTLSLSAPLAAAVNAPFNITLGLTAATAGTSAPTGTIAITYTDSSGITSFLKSIPATQALVSTGTQVSLTIPISGYFTLAATYAGDSTYSSAVATAKVSVNATNSTLTVSGPANSFVGQALTYIVTLSQISGAPGPNISLTTTLNGVQGPPTTVLSTDATAVGGANVILTFTSAGVYTINASYPGGGGLAGGIPNLGAVSAPITTTIIVSGSKPAFNMTLDDPTASDPRGNPIKVDNDNKANSTGLTLTSSGGFNTPVNLTYTASGLPSSINVAFKDANGKVITSTTPLITGTRISLVVSGAPIAHLERPSLNATRMPFYFAGGLLCTGLLGLASRSRKLIRGLRLVGILFGVALVATTLGACDVGTCTSTQDGTATILVNATPVNSAQGAASQTITVAVTVSSSFFN